MGLFFHHFVSYLIHFIGAGEYKGKKVGYYMAAPYARVLVLHVALFIGGYLAQDTGEPIWAVVVLIGQ